MRNLLLLLRFDADLRRTTLLVCIAADSAAHFVVQLVVQHVVCDVVQESGSRLKTQVSILQDSDSD